MPRQLVSLHFGIRTSLLLLGLILGSGLAAVTLGHAQADTPLRVGFAAVDVTPEIGDQPVYLAGFGKNRKATRIRDPLMARAVVLTHGERTLAIVSVDVVGLFYDFVERVRARVPNVHLLVTSTHNHHGPDTVGLWGPGLFQSGVDPVYVKRLEDRIVDAVAAARQKMNAVSEVRIGLAADPDLIRDSRQPIVKHDELVTLEFREAQRTLGVVVQWNNHPEAVKSDNTEVTADYVGSTVAYLEKKWAAPVVYLTGTVGGLMTPINVKVRDAAGNLLPDGSFAMSDRYGVLVGELAEKALAAGRPVRLTPFDLRRREIHLPIDNNAYLIGFRLGVLKRPAFLWTGSADRALPFDPEVKKSRLCCKTEIGLLRLGALDVAAIPGEIYPELVLGRVADPAPPGADFPDAPVEPSIYGQLSGPYRMIIGLANDEVGYILPKRQWDEKAPFAYGLTRAPYGEVNSLGPETGPILCEAFRAMVQGR